MLSDFAKSATKPGRKRKPIDKASLVVARQTVDMAHHILRNWDAVAAHYGISKAAAHRLANDLSYRPSQAVVDRIRDKPLPVPPLVPVHPCPSCAARGIVKSHADGLDCHNNGGEAIVLAPGETVRRLSQPRQRRRYWRPCLPADLTPQQRASVLEFAASLAGPVPGLEVL